MENNESIKFMETYTNMAETPEWRETLINDVLGGLLKIFPDSEGVQKLLSKIVEEKQELNVKELNKIHDLSLNNPKYKDLYELYIKFHANSGVTFLHLQGLEKSNWTKE